MFDSGCKMKWIVRNDYHSVLRWDALNWYMSHVSVMNWYDFNVTQKWRTSLLGCDRRQILLARRNSTCHSGSHCAHCTEIFFPHWQSCQLLCGFHFVLRPTTSGIWHCYFLLVCLFWLQRRGWHFVARYSPLNKFVSQRCSFLTWAGVSRRRRSLVKYINACTNNSRHIAHSSFSKWWWMACCQRHQACCLVFLLKLNRPDKTSWM